MADFCRERMHDYYEVVSALKQEKLESEYCNGELAFAGNLVITGIPSGEVPPPLLGIPTYIKKVQLSIPSGLRPTVREITHDDLVTIVQV